MKYALTFVTALLLTGAGPVAAEAAPTTTKGPPVTMGDEGKHPPTATVGDKVPEMGATAPVEIGPQKKMGDEGTLPATKGMSGATPEMTAPANPPADK